MTTPRRRADEETTTEERYDRFRWEPDDVAVSRPEDGREGSERSEEEQD